MGEQTKHWEFRLATGEPIATFDGPLERAVEAISTTSQVLGVGLELAESSATSTPEEKE